MGQKREIFKDAFVAELGEKNLFEPQVKIPVNVKFSDWRADAWHDTQFLLETYRRANWAISLEVANMASIDAETVTHSKVFQRIDQYREILEKLLKDNVDEQLMMQDRSKTLERARSLSLSLLLLQDMHMALERLRSYPQIGEAYYMILYYSYFSDLTGESISSRRLSGYRTVLKYAAREDRDIDFDERRFYQLRKEAMGLYDTILWGLTSRETLKELVEMLQNIIHF